MSDITSIASIARSMYALGAEKADLERRLKEVNTELDILRKTTAPEAMAAIDPGFTKAAISGIGTLYLKSDVYAGIVNRDDAFEWLKGNGYGDLIQPVVHPSTLKAFVKEQVKLGVDLPPSFKVDPYTYAVLLKN